MKSGMGFSSLVLSTVPCILHFFVDLSHMKPREFSRSNPAPVPGLGSRTNVTSICKFWNPTCHVLSLTTLLERLGRIKEVPRPLMIMDRQNSYCKNGHPTKSNLHSQCNPNQNSNSILHRNRIKFQNFMWQLQETLESKSNPKQ